MQKSNLIEALIVSSLSNHEDYNYDLWLIFCIKNRIGLASFCNEFTLFIAKGFDSYQFDYELCDEIMNLLFLFMSDHLLIENQTLNDFSYKLETIPEPAFSIFQAFDAGEYCRKSDLPHENPVEKYTRPLINKILENLNP